MPTLAFCAVSDHVGGRSVPGCAGAPSSACESLCNNGALRAQGLVTLTHQDTCLLGGKSFFCCSSFNSYRIICFVFLIERSLVNYIFLKFIHFYLFFQLLAVGCGVPC